MNNPEENDELWKLLGKARKPEVSPYFSRNVLREIRATQLQKSGVFPWLRSHLRTVALAGTAAVLLAAGAGHFLTNSAPRATMEIARQLPAKNDYEVVSHLDELLAYEQNSLWLDDSPQ